MGPQFVAQHQHQNPKAGQVNYIYVKLHNSAPLSAGGGGTASGKLEILVANASTALSVERFSPITAADGTAAPPIVIAGFANSSTQIVAVPWTPGQAGHFCLMARWISDSAADPIRSAATGAVDPYVRLSNNVTWRNVNIVDLGAVADSSATELAFIVRNLRKDKEAISLHVIPSDRDPKRSFLDFGEVSLKLDQKLLAFWKIGKNKGSGIKRREDTIYVVDRNGGVLEDLILDPNSEGKVTISFSRKKAGQKYPRNKFFIDVVQKGKAGTIGGITYEIYTQKQ